MAAKVAVPGHLIDAVKLRMFEKKITYAEAAKEILKENPQPENPADTDNG